MPSHKRPINQNYKTTQYALGRAGLVLGLLASFSIVLMDGSGPGFIPAFFVALIGFLIYIFVES